MRGFTAADMEKLLTKVDSRFVTRRVDLGHR